MQPPSSTPRFLLGAGFLTWAVVGYPTLARLVADPARMAQPATLVWLVSFLAFGGLFWLNFHAEGQRLRILLGVQSAAAVGVLATSQAGFEGALLAIVAGQAPSALPPRPAFLWTAGLCLVGGGVFLAVFSLERAVLTALIYAGFMAFAFSVALLQEREAEGRRELARLHTELKAAQVLLAEREREQERLRIARELHDSVGHYLTALSLNLEAASHSVEGPALEHLRRAQSTSRTLLAEVREVVSSLREGPTRLAPSLRALVSGVPGLAIHLQVPEALAVSEPAAAHSVFRCVQEVITNTLRHASARNLWIDVLSTEDGGIQVRTRDDGKGARALKPGAGLTGMRERFAQLGGQVELRPAAGQGTELVAWLPARGGGA